MTERFFAPGEAWEEAKVALIKGDIATAKALLPHMEPSDAAVVRRLYLADAPAAGLLARLICWWNNRRTSERLERQ